MRMRRGKWKKKQEEKEKKMYSENPRKQQALKGKTLKTKLKVGKKEQEEENIYEKNNK